VFISVETPSILSGHTFVITQNTSFHVQIEKVLNAHTTLENAHSGGGGQKDIRRPAHFRAGAPRATRYTTAYHTFSAPTKILFSMSAPTQCRLVGAPIDGQIFLSAHCKILENF